MSTLDDYLDEALAPSGTPEGERWQVNDEQAADWAARKVRRFREQIAEKQAERDRVVAAADEWLARETKALADDAAYFEGLLADWLRREIEQDPNGKASRNLPCGVTVKRTPARESLVVEDEEALAAWLQAQEPDLVEFVPKFSKADVKKLVTRDGLKVDGVRLEPGVHGWKVDV